MKLKKKIEEKNQSIIATIKDPITKDSIKFNIVNETTLFRAKTLYTKEPVTIDWIRGFEKDSIFFDIGANVGVYTLFSALISSSKVYSFEPEANNFQLLMQNIITNNLQDLITPFQLGLSDKTELTNLNMNFFSAGMSHHTVGQTALDHSNLQPINSKIRQGIFSTTLDEICFKWGLPIPTYIKIDVDGIEHKIISKSTQVLSSSIVKSLLIEINENREEDKEIIKIITDLNFKYDKSQVNKAKRKTGAHKGYAEYLFYK